MAKNKTCKHCGSELHLSLSCFQKPMKAPVRRVAVKKVKTPIKKKPKARTRSQLVKDLDTVFSRYYRQSQADSNGNVTCYTCGAVMHWKESQTGHFFTRGRQPTRWDEENVRIQDYRCNVALNGNYIIFTRKMLAEVGEQSLEELEFRSINGDKISTPDMKELIEYYKHKTIVN